MNEPYSNKIIISGTGCDLADLIYNKVSFASPGFQQYFSKQIGDGGLSPGKLVFTEELEKFSGKSYPEILAEIVGNRPPDKMNVGGPSLVSMIHAPQMLDNEDFEVDFYGMGGRDEHTEQIFRMVRQTPPDINNYKSSEHKPTPTTDVFSDPDFDNGHGERTFVNNIGAAWDFTPELLGNEFFDADIQCFGGTALVPNIHDNLTAILKRSKQKNGITVANTVFDFRNQKNNPEKPRPLLDSTEDYRLIDPELHGDTTGCGDNFAGGIISSLTTQLKSTEKRNFNLIEAISWGVSSGGFCLFTVGGTYLEPFPGEKKQGIKAIQEDYKKALLIFY